MRNEFDDELEAALADDSSNKLDEVEPEQAKPKLFNKISIATIVGASVVTMFIGTAIGSALTAHRFESEQPAEILSVKSKSSSFDQLQDMREDVISSLTKQLAAKNNTPNNGDVQAATYNRTETTEIATKVITALVQSGIKLDDVETSKSSSNNLPKETQDAIKTMLANDTTIWNNNSSGVPSITFAGSNPAVDIKDTVAVVSQPQYSLLYAGTTKSTGNTSCVYLVTVPIAKADGTLKTVEFIVATDKTNVASVTYIGELSLAKPDALTDAVARATSALADANQNNQVSAN